MEVGVEMGVGLGEGVDVQVDGSTLDTKLYKLDKAAEL